MTEFNGWHMPLYYSSITDEHLHTRSATGLFDLSHMGRILVTGARALEFVDYLTPAHIRSAKPGQVLYSFLLNEKGQTLDDITIYLSEDWILLVVNAGNCERDLAWVMQQALQWPDVTVQNRTFDWAMIATQWPGSNAVMSCVFGDEFQPLPYYTFAVLAKERFPSGVIVSATGYTGERGYEIYCETRHVQDIWSLLLSAGTASEIWPIGLGARDSLRLEAAMPLYGHELTDDTTPLHAGLGKFLDLEKEKFIGREALLALKESGGPPFRLVGFEMKQRGPVARHGHAVHGPDQQPIGHVTSGIFSPTLQKPVGMAYVATPAKKGDELLVEIRGRKYPATVVSRPFYKRNA